MNTEKESAQNLYNKVKEARTKVMEQLEKSKVINPSPVKAPIPMFWGICTDNPNVMKSVRGLLSAEADVVWIPYGCSAHALNSLMGDMLKKKPFKPLLKYVSYSSSCSFSYHNDSHF
jgi:hypothetical protein